MEKILERIAEADSEELEKLLKAITDRHNVLFPGWDINITTIKKDEDRVEQLNRMIRILENLKDWPVCTQKEKLEKRGNL